jgi:hypothetical protein
LTISGLGASVCQFGNFIAADARKRASVVKFAGIIGEQTLSKSHEIW